ncbi:hypothetical protein CEXT_230121 [Caerostris extrusa]|uniref:Uncharacterized protein n=1 Tax=Caerostris extrusa TaxID=172846 RepID=A0AAV4UIQ0_CAEEX|nr:hypothetical protein CEXT_230121 [Caerostris extrusa]
MKRERMTGSVLHVPINEHRRVCSADEQLLFAFFFSLCLPSVQYRCLMLLGVCGSLCLHCRLLFPRRSLQMHRTKCTAHSQAAAHPPRTFDAPPQVAVQKQVT